MAWYQISLSFIILHYCPEDKIEVRIFGVYIVCSVVIVHVNVSRPLQMAFVQVVKVEEQIFISDLVESRFQHFCVWSDHIQYLEPAGVFHLKLTRCPPVPPLHLLSQEHLHIGIVTVVDVQIPFIVEECFDADITVQRIHTVCRLVFEQLPVLLIVVPVVVVITGQTVALPFWKLQTNDFRFSFEHLFLPTICCIAGRSSSVVPRKILLTELPQVPVRVLQTEI